jgi:hypothetical protein
LGSATGFLLTETVAPSHLPQHLFVEEEHCVQGLVLSAGRDIAVAGQIGEELLQFLFAG